MNPHPRDFRCMQSEQVPLFAIGALTPGEQRSMEAHISSCSECKEQLQDLAVVRDSLALLPADIARPGAPLWDRLSERIAAEAGTLPYRPEFSECFDPGWEEVAPGISCKLLSTDKARSRVSMLVRLAPGTAYPSHIHSEVEELHLLAGELWIDDRKLFPGDYNRAEPGSIDKRVWSETGCTCVLITSFDDRVI